MLPLLPIRSLSLILVCNLNTLCSLSLPRYNPSSPPSIPTSSRHNKKLCRCVIASYLIDRYSREHDHHRLSICGSKWSCRPNSSNSNSCGSSSKPSNSRHKNGNNSNNSWRRSSRCKLSNNLLWRSPRVSGRPFSSILMISFGNHSGIRSNNPFAPALSMSTSVPNFSQSPSPGPQQSAPVFNLQGTYSNGNGPSLSVSPPPAPQSAPPSSMGNVNRGPSRADQEHSHLANLFANRTDDGIDTFGNVGNLRCVSISEGSCVS